MKLRNSFVAASCAAACLLSSCGRGADETMSVWMARSEMIRQAEGADLHLLGLRRVAEQAGDNELTSFAWADVDRQVTEPELMRNYLADNSVAFDDSLSLYRRRAADGDTLLHAWAIDNGRRLMALICLAADDKSPDAETLRPRAKRLAETLIRHRDPKTGLWRRILLCPTGDANRVDPAASAMITYALLKGARTGILPQDMAEAGREGLSHFAESFVKIGETTGDGRDLLSIVDSTPDSADNTEAVGAFMLSCLEIGL